MTEITFEKNFLQALKWYWSSFAWLPLQTSTTMLAPRTCHTSTGPQHSRSPTTSCICVHQHGTAGQQCQVVSWSLSKAVLPSSSSAPRDAHTRGSAPSSVDSCYLSSAQAFRAKEVAGSDPMDSCSLSFEKPAWCQSLTGSTWQKLIPRAEIYFQNKFS